MAEKKKKKEELKKTTTRKTTARKDTSKKAKPEKVQSVEFKKGDTVTTTREYPPFPKGTQAKVLDVDEEHQIIAAQLLGDPGKDTESAIMMHPFDFFEKPKTKRGRPKKAA